MRLLVALLAVAAFAVAAPTASAQYTIDENANAVVIGSGGQSSVAIEYSTFCFVVPPFSVCPTTESVASANAVTFTDNSGGVCTDESGGEATRFNCPKRGRTEVAGTNGADSVSGSCVGTANSSLIFNGLGGDDEANAPNCSASQIDMGPGNDTATGSGTILGGDGRDTLRGRAGNDVIQGGAGRDLMIPGGGADSVSGGADPDTGSYEDRTGAQPVIVTLDNVANDGQPGEGDNIGSDVENLVGGAGDDTLTGDGGPNDIDGGDGGDVINPLGGADFVDGGTGNDRINARDGAQDRIICGEGNDQAIVDAFDTVIACEDVQASRELMPDVDNDGVPAPADCDDRDGRRRPGFTDRPGNGVDEDCSGADAPFIRILSPVQSTFTTSGRITRVLRLRVLAVPEGGRIELRCSGGRARGCFRGVKRFRSRRGAERLSIRGPVRRSRLRTGARLEVRILDADSIGKVVRFTMRTRALPSSRTLCLVPGRRSPGRCPRT
jgi:hypothetical protein